MASAKEIQMRMKSIKDTMKITNAMYMISSSKLKKAKKSLENTEPFFFAQQAAVARFMQSMPETYSKYFGHNKVKEEDIRRGYIVITADKGMAGAYNHNVLKLTNEMVMHHNSISTDEHTKLFVVGELGRQFMHKKGVEIDGQFAYTVQNPTLHRARIITRRMLQEYESGELDEIYIVYTEMINSFKMEPKCFKLLPLRKEDFEAIQMKNKQGYTDELMFYPSVEHVMDTLIPNVVSGYIYGALVESFACEHNSRMMAMQSATDSAKEMLQELQIEYNRVRQAAITQELTEVISGAKAQKNKK